MGNQCLHAMASVCCMEGPLCEYQQEIYDARLSSTFNVSSLVQNGNWCWPVEWNPYPILSSLKTPSLTNDPYDEVFG